MDSSNDRLVGILEVGSSGLILVQCMFATSDNCVGVVTKVSDCPFIHRSRSCGRLANRVVVLASESHSNHQEWKWMLGPVMNQKLDCDSNGFTVHDSSESDKILMRKPKSHWKSIGSIAQNCTGNLHLIHCKNDKTGCVNLRRFCLTIRVGYCRL